MSGPDQKPNTPDDRELEEFLAGRGALRETYRAGANEKSPASVDDAILKMAAQAVAEPAAPAVKRRTLRRWPASLAAAAVLVLSLSVFVEMHRDPVAGKAILAPIAMDAPQAPPAAAPAESPKSPAMEQLPLANAPAYAEQAKRSRDAMKKEKAEADAAGALARMPAPPEPKMLADRAAQPMQEAESSAVAKAEPEARADVLRDAQEPAAPAMMAKSLRAAPADHVAAAAPAPAPVEVPPGASAFDQQIDHWLRTCAADSGPTLLPTDSHGKFKDMQQWRDLPVTGFVDGALQFAPAVSREAVVAQLDQIDPAAIACLGAASSGNVLQLHCGCLKH